MHKPFPPSIHQRWQPSFWVQPRPAKTSHSELRPRNRTKAFTSMDCGVKPGVNFEVRNFRIYGDLRRTETEVRNTLPTALTIETEKTLHCFEQQRQVTPMDADYSQFYRCLSASVVPMTTVPPHTPTLHAINDGNNTTNLQPMRPFNNQVRHLSVDHTSSGYLLRPPR